jgi:putative peptidoglycan lipid II flippase
LINAGWLLAALMRRGSYQPAPGWGAFGLQVIGASALLAAFLLWAAAAFPWIGMRSHGLQRAGLMAAVLFASAAIYFVALRATGLKLRQFVTR